MDAGLAAELGVDRLHRQTVGLGATVTAALAHGLIDDDSQGRLSELAALAMASLLSGTLLVIDQNRGPRDLPQVTLGCVQSLTVPHLGITRQLSLVILAGILGHHNGFAHP